MLPKNARFGEWTIQAEIWPTFQRLETWLRLRYKQVFR
jgi:hypothetical protein